ncbi:MAG: hypothetical protein QOF66_4105 [Mycobacterium sp.]|nr:hypothetical protein [Mycobacterium sp.]MDT5055739.1 hypothetical protein [Mycobacterium sp.]
MRAAARGVAASLTLIGPPMTIAARIVVGFRKWGAIWRVGRMTHLNGGIGEGVEDDMGAFPRHVLDDQEGPVFACILVSGVRHRSAFDG